VSFRPGPRASVLTIAGATGAGADGGQERFETDLLDLQSGTLHPFGPAGLRPGDGSWAWLSNGSLLSWRPAGAYGGDPGVYLVAQEGTAMRIFASGRPIGVISI